MTLDQYHELEYQLTETYNQLNTLLRMDQQPEQQVDLEKQIAALEADLALLQPKKPEVTDEQCRTLQEVLAVTRWATLPMLAYAQEQEEQVVQPVLGALLELRQAEPIRSASGRVRVPTRIRAKILQNWEDERRTDLAALSKRMADHCKECAERATTTGERDEWLAEQIYLLVAADAAMAMRQMANLYDQAIAQHDLNRAHFWLLPLEERCKLLEKQQAAEPTPPRWIMDLERRRDNLTMRSFYTAEWYRTFSYLERSMLRQAIDRFYTNQSSETLNMPHPWLMDLHAPGGYGKTALIEWFLSRYAAPQGYVCARFDYDSLNQSDITEYARDPVRIVRNLAQQLNAQRTHRIEALERLNEQRSDLVGDFILMLHETYAGQLVILLIDTIEVLLENRGNSKQALLVLIQMLRRIHEGDISDNGSIPGYSNLRVILSGRHDLRKDFAAELAKGLNVSDLDQQLVTVPVQGFNRAEATTYLLEKRKLKEQQQHLIDPILNKIIELRVEGNGAQAEEILPLKLAMAADLLKIDPNITADQIEKFDELDFEFLARRILARIHNEDLKWMLRYGVIFRRLDMVAIDALRQYIIESRRGDQRNDTAARDPKSVRREMELSRQQTTPLADIQELFEQLTQYSWVVHDEQVIRFHILVRKPQIEILQKQRVFLKLQKAAFEHFKARAAVSSTPEQQSIHIREAVYHGFYLKHVGVQYWREQLAQFRGKSALVLRALVEEAFENRDMVGHWRPQAQERYDAYLALAEARLAQHEQSAPEAIEQRKGEESNLGAAQASVSIALQAAGRNTAKRFCAYRVKAKVLLARREQSAYAAAEHCVDLEASVDRAAAATAYELLGLAEIASSRWDKALEHLNRAYELSKEAVGLTLSVIQLSGRAIHQHIRATLIDQLLSSSKWYEAPALVQDALREQPDNSQVLELAARLAAKKGQLKKADQYYTAAYERATSNVQRERLAAERGIIQLWHHRKAVQINSPLYNVVEAFARADWREVDTQMRRWENTIESASSTPNTIKAIREPSQYGAEALQIINQRLQFYLEITGEWRHVVALRDQGVRIAPEAANIDSEAPGSLTVSTGNRIAPTDPAFARFGVLYQYAEFLSQPLPLVPSEAHKIGKQWQGRIRRLATPEDRVRAKGWLLLVRFFGAFDPLSVQSPIARRAMTIYHTYATQALDEVLALLLRLAPVDQIDIMRTLAALPGWSSALVNHLAPDPSGRTLLDLLDHVLSSPQNMVRKPFLLRFMGQSMVFEQTLVTLGEQIFKNDSDESTSDWPLLYSSYAQLLAACGDPKGALHYFNQIPGGLDSIKHPLIALDYARITLQNPTLAVEHVTQTANSLRSASNSIGVASELLLSAAWLYLQHGSLTEHVDQARKWLDQIETWASASPWGLLFQRDVALLRTVLAVQGGNHFQADQELDKSVAAAKQLGSPLLQRRISDTRGRLSPLQQPTTPQHQHNEGFTTLFELYVTEMSETIAVRFVTHDQGNDPLTYTTTMNGIKSLLPQGKRKQGLPDFDYWHKLLNRDSSLDIRLSVIGQTLLADVLPPSSQNTLEEVAPTQVAIRLFIRGEKLECLPWGLLHGRDTWLTQRFVISHGIPQPDMSAMVGAALVISTAGTRPDRGGLSKVLEQIYKSEPENAGLVSQFVASLNRFSTKAPLAESLYKTRVLSDDTTVPVKLVHLVLNLSEVISNRRGSLVLGAEENTLHISGETIYGSHSPEALASALQQTLSPGLIILEPLTTWSVSEDIRVLMLRNSYAAQLARLGAWTVLAIGPRSDARSDHIINDLLQQIVNTENPAPMLEEWVNTAQAKLAQSETSRLLEQQIDLYYSQET